MGLLLLLFTAALLQAQPLITIYQKTVDTPSGGGAKDISGLINEAFVEQYATQNHLEPAPAELDAMRVKWNRNKAQRPNPATPSSSKLDELWIRRLIVYHKVNRHLFQKHGGRLVLSAFGFHLATDAWLKEIALLEQAGQIRFQTPAIRESYFKTQQQYRGDGIVQGAKAMEILNHPVWE